MSELKHILREIEKHKNLEANLPKYLNTMMSICHRYANLRLVFNSYTCYEKLSESQKIPEDGKALAMQVEQVIRDYILTDLTPEMLEGGLEKIHKIRNQIIHIMKILVCYADDLRIYEAVLNRVEYRFVEQSFPFQYSDEKFIKQIMEYVASDQDKAVMNSKISNMIGQLPVRITRQRFYEIIKGGFSLYIGSEREAVKDFLYRLRTCTMLEKPEGAEELYPELKEILSALEETDYMALCAEDYENLSERLAYAADFIQECSDFYMILEEIVNDTYIILLSKSYALTDAREAEVCYTILENLQAAHTENSYPTLEKNAYNLLETLEGKQERLYEQMNVLEYGLDTIQSYQDLLQSLVLDKMYQALKRITKLTSSSVFIELDREMEEGIADEGYVAEVCNTFLKEIAGQLQSCERLVARSIMAAALENLPIFFNNLEEFKEYVHQALLNCSDEKEKLAAVRLIEMIIEDISDIDE